VIVRADSIPLALLPTALASFLPTAGAFTRFPPVSVGSAIIRLAVAAGDRKSAFRRHLWSPEFSSGRRQLHRLKKSPPTKRWGDATSGGNSSLARVRPATFVNVAVSKWRAFVNVDDVPGVHSS
jgi:hypothetical protein